MQGHYKNQSYKIEKKRLTNAFSATFQRFIRFKDGSDLVDGVYKLNLKQIDCLFTPVSGHVWHRSFVHQNSADLNKETMQLMA